MPFPITLWREKRQWDASEGSISLNGFANNTPTPPSLAGTLLLPPNSDDPPPCEITAEQQQQQATVAAEHTAAAAESRAAAAVALLLSMQLLRLIAEQLQGAAKEKEGEKKESFCNLYRGRKRKKVDSLTMAGLVLRGGFRVYADVLVIARAYAFYDVFGRYHRLAAAPDAGQLYQKYVCPWEDDPPAGVVFGLGCDSGTRQAQA
ncbi:hypothetical protein ACMD2_19231 [Ananas comosus]|uniref:Uncharacterized protein n=1 Tax=Ananas comosus TaxID=4615 RepID=A0A199UTW7_ANACO|nr:hypothetical protein ACMD2_19231 [Ananas comosus]